MIHLHPDFLWFQISSGDTIPCSAEIATVELMGESASMFDPEVIRSAAAAVLHYFKSELGQDCVSVAEFSRALVRVLRGFGLKVSLPDQEPEADPTVAESDLRLLAAACDEGLELAFFPRLRNEMRQHLAASPRLVRFRGLRSCVKQLTGARRWTPRCQKLNDQIVEYLRVCLHEATPAGSVSLEVR